MLFSHIAPFVMLALLFIMHFDVPLSSVDPSLFRNQDQEMKKTKNSYANKKEPIGVITPSFAMNRGKTRISLSYRQTKKSLYPYETSETTSTI